MAILVAFAPLASMLALRALSWRIVAEQIQEDAYHAQTLAAWARFRRIAENFRQELASRAFLLLVLSSLLTRVIYPASFLAILLQWLMG